MLRQPASASVRLLPPLTPRAATVLATRLQMPTQRRLFGHSHSHSHSHSLSHPAAQRLYSAAAGPEAKDKGAKPATTEEANDVADESKEDSGGVADANAESETGSVEATLKKALEAKEAEVREWKEVAMRSKAEFLNLQSRSARDQKAAREFAIQSFAKDLLDNIDNLDRALGTVPQTKLDAIKAAGDNQSEDAKDLANLYEGLHLTESGLMQTLSRHGLVRFDPLNEKFNPNEHEATFMTPQPDKEDGTVFHVQQKGFRLNGRVVRAAKVGVVRNN